MAALMTFFVAQLMLVACQDDPTGSSYPECALGSPTRNALQTVIRDCPAQADPDACARRLMASARMPDTPGKPTTRGTLRSNTAGQQSAEGRFAHHPIA